MSVIPFAIEILKSVSVDGDGRGGDWWVGWEWEIRTGREGWGKAAAVIKK